MKKAIKFARNGAIVLGVGNAIFNIIKQANSQVETPINWKEVGIALLKGGVVGAGSGFIVGRVSDYFNEKEKPLKIDEQIFEMINKIRLDKTDKVYQKVREKANWIVEIGQHEFKNKLKRPPFTFGSTEKETALRDNFDVDICFSFKPYSFSSTENMYLGLEDFFRRQIGRNGLIAIRRQTKSIGAIFNIGGEEHRVDILPQKITSKRGNHSSGYIYVNNKGVFSESTYTKTDARLLNNIKLSETQKKLLVVLKDWKERESIPISSHLLQYLILDAYKFNAGFSPRTFSKKLIMVIKHIADNIDTAYICSVENSNNVVTNIPEEDKALIKSACKKIVDEYAYQPNSILSHFG